MVAHILNSAKIIKPIEIIVNIFCFDLPHTGETPTQEIEEKEKEKDKKVATPKPLKIMVWYLLFI